MKRSHEEALKILLEKYPNIEMNEPYINGNIKMTFQCTKCGHIWKTPFRAVIRSACGCPKCGVKEAADKRAVQDLLNRMSKDFELIEYKDYLHISVKCKHCGTIRITNQSNLLRYGCKHCKLKNAPQCQAKTTELFSQEAKIKHNNKYDYSKVIYTNEHAKICIICPEHGEFYQTPMKHLAGLGCPRCVGKYSTKESFLKKAKLVHGNFYNYDKTNYINATTPVIITCPKHGDFEIIPSRHIGSRCGCKQCSESTGEKIVDEILRDLNIKYTREYTILNPYNTNHNFRVDFYIEYNNAKYIIEYNGIQHYRPVKHWGGEVALEVRESRDENLRIYCSDNNIKLLEIKYDSKSIRKLIEEFLAVPSNQVIDLSITE